MQAIPLLRHRSLRTKVLLFLVLIGVFTLLAIVLGFVTSRVVAGSYAKLLETTSQLELVLTRVSDGMNRVAKIENSFVITRDPKLLEQRSAVIERIQTLQNEVRSIQQDVVSPELLQSLFSQLESYQKHFEVISLRIQEEGSANSGHLGAMRKQAHAMESIIKANLTADRYRLLVFYLSIRRHEKNYLARREASYIDKVQTENEELAAFVKVASSMSNSQKTEIVATARAYKDKLSEIETGYKDILASRSRQSEDLEKLDSLMAEVSDLVRRHNQGVSLELDKLMQIVNVIYILTALFIAVILVLASVEFLGLARYLSGMAQNLRQSSDKALSTSRFLNVASEKSSAAASEQASAIQETVATLNEISAMVQKSVETAESSSGRAQLSYQKSVESKDVVHHMRETMQSLRATLQGLIEQTRHSNKRVGDVIAIVDRISARTAVINDIVLQTKLLSFNASVEAARAGEQGKGFTVVAEEVGVLARMSGDAAKEITALLRQSREEVSHIIAESQAKIEEWNSLGEEKMSEGLKLADLCEQALTDVVGEVEAVKGLMSDISMAAKEESTGIENITTAMAELDTATSANADLGHEILRFSQDLKLEAESLDREVESLLKIVSGSAAKPTSEAQSTASSRDISKGQASGPEKVDTKFQDVA